MCNVPKLRKKNPFTYCVWIRTRKMRWEKHFPLFIFLSRDIYPFNLLIDVLYDFVLAASNLDFLFCLLKFLIRWGISHFLIFSPEKKNIKIDDFLFLPFQSPSTNEEWFSPSQIRFIFISMRKKPEYILSLLVLSAEASTTTYPFTWI